jgi:DNA-binding beta-propeller fold protein YncE
MAAPMPSIGYHELIQRIQHGDPQARIPIQGSMELTYRCNLACVHCWVNLPANDRVARARELTLAEILRITEWGALTDLDIDPASSTVVVVMGTEDKVAVVNVADLTHPTVTYADVAPLPIPPAPSAVAVLPGLNRAVVTNVGDLTLSVFDLGTPPTELYRIPLNSRGEIDSPVFVAADPGINVAVVLDQSSQPDIISPSVLLVDIVKGEVTYRIPIADPDDPFADVLSAVAINPVTHTAVVANQGRGTILVIDLMASPPSFREIQICQPLLPCDPAGVSIDPVTNIALVTSFRDNTITAVNLATEATVVFQFGLNGAITPLDVAWVPDPVTGVVLVSKLLELADDTSLMDIGFPTPFLPLP